MPAKSDPLAAWRKHVQKFRSENPGLDLKTALTMAKETYHKSEKKAVVAKAPKAAKSGHCKCGGTCGKC